ncbi:MAG: substrate-binding domain-containing protein, partial [Anaerolineales bacterium]
MHRKIFSVLLLMVLLLSACTPTDSADTETEVEVVESEKPTIGLVMKSLGAEFFKAMEEGAIAHAEERGDLELIALGTQSQSELDQQISIVENLTSQGVDAIVIAPMDSKALVAPIAKAIEAGIEVINIDVPLDADAMEEAGIDLAFVGPDNVGAAKMVGDVLGEELGEGGKVIIIEGLPGAENAQQRKEGFMQSVEEYGLEVLASQTANWEAEEANTVFTNLLTANPDVEGVMCANDAMAL